MSGICGIYKLDGQLVKESEIQDMLDTMQNRGNDNEGILVDDNIGFGHKMLWTTPESLHENQPISTVNNNIILTADARIDNRSELLDLLDINTDVNSIITDAELILLSYNKWGIQCSEYLIGDFACALWDKKNKHLFFMRDHLGLKPFYFAKTKDYFIFASEISALKSFKKFNIELDLNTIKMSFNKGVFPCNKTFYKGINRLLSAHYGLVNEDKIVCERYWFPEKISVNNKMTIEEAKQTLKKILNLSIQDRLRSAYPIGSELSGGLDSSTISILAHKLNKSKEITLFTFSFGDLACDETDFSTSVINHLNAEYINIRADKLDYISTYNFDNYLNMTEDWDPNGALYLEESFKKAQKNGIRVILTGYGGDEVITGNTYMLHDLLKDFKFKQFFKQIRQYSLSRYFIKKYILRPFFHNKYWDIPSHAYDTFCYKVDTNKIKSYANKIDLAILLGPQTSHFIDQFPYRLSGHYDIEYRHPFLDKRLVEFLFSLPSYFKLKDRTMKILLRETFKDDLPSIIYKRKDKTEFSSFMQHVIQNVDLKYETMEVVKHNFLSQKEFELSLNKYKAEKNVYNINKFFQILRFEFFLKKWRNK